MRTTILLILPLLLFACVAGEVSPTGKTYPARPSDWPISLYAKGTVPAEVAKICQIGTPPGRSIGTIEVGGARATPWGDLMSKARDKARSIGGDAVLFTSGDVFLRVLRGKVYRSQ